MAQKSAEKWIRKFVKDLRDAPKKEETIVSHLWREAIVYAEKLYTQLPSNSKPEYNESMGPKIAGLPRVKDCTSNNDYLNILDKTADSTSLKLSDLVSELSKFNVEYISYIRKLQKHKNVNPI